MKQLEKKTVQRDLSSKCQSCSKQALKKEQNQGALFLSSEGVSLALPLFNVCYEQFCVTGKPVGKVDLAYVADVN